ncbi:hypothetical protein ANO11243_026260 [Dothideomycetidae sp. 11243]|nr:hypothetical protein ANO11243_026260 [fungal sp. No.11243]
MKADRSEGCSVFDTQVKTVENVIVKPVPFCKAYLDAPRTVSPVLGLSAFDVTESCVCILEKNLVSLPKMVQPKPKPTKQAKCDHSAAKLIRRSFREPVAFCKFFDAQTGTSDSFAPGLTAAMALNGCKCIVKGSASASGSATTAQASETAAGPSETGITGSSEPTAEPSAVASTTAGGEPTPSLSCEAAPTSMFIDVFDTVANNPVTANVYQYWSGSHSYAVVNGMNTTTLASQNVTLAASSCASYVGLNQQQAYRSYDINMYYDLDADNWMCSFWYDNNHNLEIEAFNTVGANVGCSYGFVEDRM